MKLVVTDVSATLILWRRASALESPTQVPASTLPAREIAPVRANIASNSVVLPLWKGPTSAMHRGPRGLLTSCPIAASSCGARPVIGSATLYAVPLSRFWQGGKSRCGASCPGRGTASFTMRRRAGTHKKMRRSVAWPPDQQRTTNALCPGNGALTSRTQFQAFEARRDAQADLSLQAERLKRDRIVGTADQDVAASPDANRRASLCAGIIAGEVAGPEISRRREYTPGERCFLCDAEIDADLADGSDVAVFRPAVDAEHAAEIGDRTHDEADARAAAAFEHADLNQRGLLGLCAGQ